MGIVRSVGAVLVIAALVSACGGSMSSSSARDGGAAGSTGGGTSAPAMTPGPASSSSEGAAAQSTAAAATDDGSSRCRVGQLSVRLVRVGAAAGNIGETYAFRNSSGSACALDGYPGLLMLSTAGTAMPTHVRRGSSVTVPPETPRPVVLRPGGRASFFLGYSDVPRPGEACPAGSRLEITPPNDYGHLVIDARLAPCGGRITVSPVHPGTPPPA